MLRPYFKNVNILSDIPACSEQNLRPIAYSIA